MSSLLSPKFPFVSFGNNVEYQLGQENQYFKDIKFSNKNLNVKTNLNKNLNTNLTELKQIKKIALGCNYSIILTESNEIYVCGSNIIYQLGNLKKTIYQTKIHSYYNIYYTNSYYYSNNNLNEQFITKFIKLNKETTNDNFINELGMIKDISCGYEHTIIVNEENELFGSGCNFDGQLGFEEDKIIKGFTKITVPIELKELKIENNL